MRNQRLARNIKRKQLQFNTPPNYCTIVTLITFCQQQSFTFQIIHYDEEEDSR